MSALRYAHRRRVHRGGADFTRGTGLAGLKDRVEALGGRIRIDSPRGAGTSVEVKLPLTASDDGAVGLPAEGFLARLVTAGVPGRRRTPDEEMTPPSPGRRPGWLTG
jgi:hypothetical protein